MSSTRQTTPRSTTTTTTTSSSLTFVANYSGSYWSTVLSLLFAGVASLNLYAEIQYLLLRIGLPDGDSGIPILGHFLSWVVSPRSYNCKRLLKSNGEPFVMNFLMTPCIFFTSEEDVKWVMTQERKGNLVASCPEYIKNLLGLDSILWQTGKTHKRLRRIMEPSFSPLAVKSYAKTIDEIVQSQLEQWCNDDAASATKKDGGGDELSFIPSSDSLATLALRLLFECVFGKVPDESIHKFHRLFDKWIAGITPWFPFRVPGNCLYKAHQAKAELGKDIQKLVNEFKRNNPPPPGAADDTSSTTTTILGRMCYGVDDEGQSLTDEELIQNLMLLFFAGHDTTKASLASCMHYLVEQPTSIRDLLIQEVQSFSEPPNVEELKAAPLLNAFLAETWRLVPPAEAHETEAVVDLQYKEYNIQKGVAVGIDLASYAVMNDKLFPDPLEFRMERWIHNKDHPLYNPKFALGDKVDYNMMSPKFRTFSIGAHQCLGANFAKLEARIVVTRLLQQYDLEIQNDKLIVTPILQYSNEFKLTKRRRNESA